jgi:hypothetical protein
MARSCCYNSSNHLRFHCVPRNQAASRKLYETAHVQSGFFTARQAREAGYADSVHPVSGAVRSLGP